MKCNFHTDIVAHDSHGEKQKEKNCVKNFAPTKNSEAPQCQHVGTLH